MAEVVVFGEDEVAVGGGECDGELVAVASAFEDGDGDAEVGGDGGFGIEDKQMRDAIAAEAVEPAVGNDGQAVDGGEGGF